MTAPVVANDPEALGERRQLRLPHRERRTEGARENERRSVGRTVDDVVEPHGASARSAS